MAVDHEHWADYLLDAVDRREAVMAITKQVDALSLDDAYAIQAALLDRRLARGEVLVGAKLGLTSVAKQQQMGVDEPVYGWITDQSVLVDGEVPVGELIHPRVEPEFVFRLAEDVSGADVSVGDVLDATAEVLGGIEVIDSRYEAFSFTLPDVIADNTSAARVRLGAAGVPPRDVDVPAIGCTFDIDGETAGQATGAALLGDPAACVAMLAHHLHRYGRRLEAGWIVLAGAATDARPLGIGTRAVARYDRLAEVAVLGT